MEKEPFRLGELANPYGFTEPLDLRDESPELLSQLLRTMIEIRVAEEIIGDGVTEGKVKCPCHLAIGQEAIAVGVASALTKTDRVFGTHRSHSHFLAQGGSVYSLFAEILGKETGCSKGMGGSMHLYDAASGFVGSVPIVGATVPMAVGAALAAKMSRTTDVGVAYFGDGAMEEGAVHESLNFARTFSLPVLFVVENNFFSSHLHIEERQPSNSVARFAQAHDINFRVVDGNDVVKVREATLALLQSSRRGGGPAFLEAVTYRWRGHVGPREDQDVGVMRKDDLAQWKRRDPVGRLAVAMESKRYAEQSVVEKITSEVRKEFLSAWSRAENDPYPVASALLSRVYLGKTT